MGSGRALCAVFFYFLSKLSRFMNSRNLKFASIRNQGLHAKAGGVFILPEP